MFISDEEKFYEYMLRKAFFYLYLTFLHEYSNMNKFHTDLGFEHSH